MEHGTLVALASQAGVQLSAIEDVGRRAETHFRGQEPSDVELATWLSALKGAAPHLFTPPPRAELPPWEQLGISETWWNRLPPSEKANRWRRLHPPAPPQKRRPEPYEPSAEELRELDTITAPMARLARYREMQAAAQETR
jgi:hypothetical protein